jgi:hypothetical protein
LHRERRETTARLRQAAPFAMGVTHRVGEPLVRRQCVMAGDRFVEINGRARRPAREIRLPHPSKRIAGNGGFGERR